MQRLHASLRRAFLVGTLVPFTTVGAQQPAPIDWNRLLEETVQILSDYLKINTTNPPGNELQAARFLKRILDREGIPAQILDTAELEPRDRANLYARLKGNGTKKAIALVHHMDVVPADPRYWSVDPFSGQIKDGYIWGRGALDMKGEGIIHLMAMIALERAHVPLDRDVVFIANADEELDGSGAETFVRRHADLLKDVEFLITEGGDNKFENGTLEYYGVGVAEKRTFWQRVTVHGTPSHGSRPTKLNPVPKLIAALNRIAQYETPLHVTPGVERYFRDISRNYRGDQRRWLSNVSVALGDSTARRWILDDVYWNAILRNTISLTGLHGSSKTNVIPPEASADLDIRLLPDADEQEFLARLRSIAADTAVHFERELTPKPPLESPIQTEFFQAVERAAHDRDPTAFVTTPMLTGGTDRPAYRQLGIVTYGLDPFRSRARMLSAGYTVMTNDSRSRTSALACITCSTCFGMPRVPPLA